MAGRKDSYASVREDSDVPQSFRVRRPTTDSARPSVSFPRRLRPFPVKRSASTDSNEEAIDDESEVSAYSSLEDLSIDENIRSTQPTGLEGLPDEVLDMIFDRVQIDTTLETYMRPQVDLFTLLFVSRKIHAAALRVMYRHVSVYKSKTFHKLTTAIEQDPELGKLIHCLDLSHYSKMGYKWSSSQISSTPYLTRTTLQRMLTRTPQLKAFLTHEHVDEELDAAVLETLFSIQSLRAVDFSGCTSALFSAAWTHLVSTKTSLKHVRRLCFHECTTLKASIFESILPQLEHVTHLDLAHTAVTDRAIFSIPASARLTHLNLERCTQISGANVVTFLTSHPAASNLVWLNLNADASRYRLLDSQNLYDMLPYLPTTLKSLNLGGAKTDATHVPDLRRLATQLEELGLKGADLSLSSDVTRILSLPAGKCDHPTWRHNLHYIDLTDIPSVTQMSLLYNPIDITAPSTSPLEVIELSSKVLNDITASQKRAAKHCIFDWVVKENGRRGWYVRCPTSVPGQKTDDGYRSWKWGARWWGMRKIPVVRQEVSGMYGYFMFKRN